VGPAGKNGLNGTNGTNGTDATVTEGVTVSVTTPGDTAKVFCPAATPYATGGGGTVNVTDLWLSASYPIGINATTNQATGWEVSFTDCPPNITATTVYVECST
jgi:hypothetical protein